MGHQVDRRHLDHGARGGDATDAGAGDARGEQPVHQLVGEQGQLFGADRAGDDDVGDLIEPDAAPDLGVFGLGGQGGDAVDGLLHIVAGAAHVIAGFELQPDRGAAFEGRAGTAFDALYGQQRGFEQLHDGAVHVLGPGALPDHGNRDVIDHHIGKELRTHPGHGGDADDQQHDQQQVGGGAVAGEIRQDAARAVGDLAGHDQPPIRDSSRSTICAGTCGSCRRARIEDLISAGMAELAST